MARPLKSRLLRNPPMPPLTSRPITKRPRVSSMPVLPRSSSSTSTWTLPPARPPSPCRPWPNGPRPMSRILTSRSLSPARGPVQQPRFVPKPISTSAVGTTPEVFYLFFRHHPGDNSPTVHGFQDTAQVTEGHGTCPVTCISNDTRLILKRVSSFFFSDSIPNVYKCLVYKPAAGLFPGLFAFLRPQCSIDAIQHDAVVNDWSLADHVCPAEPLQVFHPGWTGPEFSFLQSTPLQNDDR